MADAETYNDHEHDATYKNESDAYGQDGKFDQDDVAYADDNEYVGQQVSDQEVRKEKKYYCFYVV